MPRMIFLVYCFHNSILICIKTPVKGKLTFRTKLELSCNFRSTDYPEIRHIEKLNKTNAFGLTRSRSAITCSKSTIKNTRTM